MWSMPTGFQGIVPDLTSSQITPAAISNNGPNKDLLCSMILFPFNLREEWNDRMVHPPEPRSF
jgi:hypothetical protein